MRSLPRRSREHLRTAPVAVLLAALAACSSSPRASSGAGGAAGSSSASPHTASTSSSAASTTSSGSGGAGGAADTYPAPHPPAPQILSAGGPVLAAATFVPVTFTGDPNAADIDTFVAGLGATSYWAAIGKDYGVGPATAAPPIHLAATAPPTVDDAGVQAFLTSQLDGTHAEWGTPDATRIYTLFYPAGTTVAYDGLQGCADFVGAYHEFVTIGGTTMAYAVVSACPTGIFQTTGFDVITTSASHELIEAATDPFGTAFSITDAADLAVIAFAYGAEVGDMCEFGTPVRPAGFGYAVTRAWSNTAAAASHAPCVPADPGPYFASAVVTTDAVSFDLLGQALPTQGIKIDVGSSKVVELDLFSDAPTAGPWTIQAVDTHTAGQAPFLSFALAPGSGSNGDKVELTIDVKGQDPNYGAEPFVVISQLGEETSYWFGVVGN